MRLENHFKLKTSQYTKMVNSLVLAVVVWVVFTQSAEAGFSHIETPQCVVSGWPPKASVTWRHSEENSKEPVTYNVLHCPKPRLENMFCARSNKGYSMTSGCTTKVKGQPREMTCDLRKVVQKEFPDLELGGRHKLCVMVEAEGLFGTIQSRRRCCNLLRTSCTIPRNVRVEATKNTEITVTWDAPNDMGLLKNMLYYTIGYVETSGQQKESVSVQPMFNQIKDISHVITGLAPNTTYKVSVSCSLGDNQSMGPFTNPLTVTTPKN